VTGDPAGARRRPRLGAARIVHWGETWVKEGKYQEVGFVGTSRLDIPFVPPPPQS